MIGCFNLNGHDCNQSDLDTLSFVPIDVLEDGEVRRRNGHEALIYDPFEDDDDSCFEETFWSSHLLGSDYDWPSENVIAWVQERYADVIRLNDELGFRPPSAEAVALPASEEEDEEEPVTLVPSFFGRSRSNIAHRRHWSEPKSLRRENVNRDHLRGKAHRK